jgi:hypothetical protein
LLRRIADSFHAWPFWSAGVQNTARQITDEESRLNTFSDLCQVLLEAKNFDAAIRIAHDEVYPEERPWVMLQIADGLLKAGQTDRGNGIAQEAFELALGSRGGGDDALERFAPVIVRDCRSQY